VSHLFNASGQYACASCGSRVHITPVPLGPLPETTTGCCPRPDCAEFRRVFRFAIPKQPIEWTGELDFDRFPENTFRPPTGA
jgi:hypothetical protein